MATQVHIEHIDDTEANLRTNLDLSQIGIFTDQAEEFVWMNDDASKLKYGAIQKHWNGAALVYEDNDFGEVTLHDDLLISEYAKRSGGTDDYIRWQNDSITIAAGGVTAADFQDDQVFLPLPTTVGSSSVVADGTLHVHTASAGSVTANSAADDLIVENTTSGGISILTNDASSSIIYFGSPSDETGGTIAWNYGSKLFKIGGTTASSQTVFRSGDGVEAARFDANGNMGLAQTTPLVDLHIGGSNADREIRISAGTGGTNTATINMGTGTRDWDIVAEQSPYNLEFNYVGTDAALADILVLTKGGNLGVGIGAPGGKTHIYSGASGATPSGTGNNLIVENSTNVGMSLLCPQASSASIYCGTVGDDIFTLIRSNYNAKTMTIGTSLAGGELIFLSGNGVEAARFNASGVLGVGAGSNSEARLDQKFEVATSASWGGMVLSTWSTTNDEASVFDFLKSGHATIGSHTIVADNEVLGSINFRGSNATTFLTAAEIRATIDGTPGAASMPGQLEFYTTLDGSSTATQKMVLNNAGDIGLGTSSPLNNVGGASGDLTGHGLHIKSDTANNELAYLVIEGGAQVAEGLGPPATGLIFADALSAAGDNMVQISSFANNLYIGHLNATGTTDAGDEYVRFTDAEVVFNEDGAERDFRVEGGTDSYLFFIEGTDETQAVRMGGQSAYFTTLSGGASYWVGEGLGLVFADMYAYDANDTITISGTGIANKVKITSFNTNGLSNNMSADHTNNHITVSLAGKYLCTVSTTIESVGGGSAITIGSSVWKNAGATEFSNLHYHRDLAGGGGDTGSTSMSGLIDLAASDTIAVYIWNETNTNNIIVDDITLSLVMVGGT